MNLAISDKHFRYAFYLGLAAVMLSLAMWFIPDWLTFIHTWRVEFFASIFLLLTLVIVFFQAGNLSVVPAFTGNERKFILLPILAFILWSALSVAWAPSWKSAVHHTLIWSVYLIFYSFVRQLLEHKGQYRPLLYVFVGSLIFYSLPAIGGYVGLSLFGGVNSLGMGFARFGEQVVLILPLVLVAVVRLEGRKFKFGVGVACVLLLFMFCTFSRTNYILISLAIVGLGGVIFLFKQFRVYRGRFAVTAAAMIAVTILAAALPSLSVSETPRVHRFNDSGSIQSSNNFRKLMVALSTEMITAHPIVGIGADNFGFEINKYREAFARRNPADPRLSAAENELPERAHNEYLQIFAELGIIGIAIFSWFVLGIAILGVRTLRGYRSLPLHAYAAVIGIALFLASSIVTSYSFRLIQNGFVFFFVLAVAAKILSRDDKTARTEPQRLSAFSIRTAAAAGIIVCALLTIYTSTRVASVILSRRANAIENLDDAAGLYERAMTLDAENPEPEKTLGMRNFYGERYSEAAKHLARSIDMGYASSTHFSYLASAYSLAGDNSAAENTMERAAVYYPHSVFVLTRYSSLLKQNGKTDDAVKVFARAAEIDPRSTETWRSMIEQGAKTTSERSAIDENILPVMQLVPNPAIFAVQTERLIRFPEERKFSMLQIGGQREAALPPSK